MIYFQSSFSEADVGGGEKTKKAAKDFSFTSDPLLLFQFLPNASSAGSF